MLELVFYYSVCVRTLSPYKGLKSLILTSFYGQIEVMGVLLYTMKMLKIGDHEQYQS